MRIKLTAPNSKAKTISEGFKEFNRYCRVKNLSEKTLDFYEECLARFCKFYPEEGLLSDITQQTVEEYILFLKTNTGFNSVSINSSLRGLRAILYHFMKTEHVPEFKIQLVKSEKNVKETYTEAELRLLLKKPDIKHCIFTEYRDWVIINYLLSTGNRLNTVINLRIGNIDFENSVIMLEKTKNRKQQVVPLSKTLNKVLAEYVQYRKGELTDYLFCSIYGEKLTPNALGHSIRKYNIKRGVGKTSIHLFRHTFAKNWILAGGDIFRLQKLLGHSSMDIVREYVNMFSDDLQKDFDRFNPLEQIACNGSYITMR